MAAVYYTKNGWFKVGTDDGKIYHSRKSLAAKIGYLRDFIDAPNQSSLVQTWLDVSTVSLERLLLFTDTLELPTTTAEILDLVETAITLFLAHNFREILRKKVIVFLNDKGIIQGIDKHTTLTDLVTHLKELISNY